MNLSFDRSLDASDMFADLLAWPAMLVRGWEAGRGSARPHKGTSSPRSVLWAGMGGSAIGGDFLASLLAKQASFPVTVHRGGPLPVWVGTKDLVVLVSYSGGTAETLATAAEALDRGCRLAVLTSGGQLADLASEHGLEHWPVTGGKMPRAMLAELFSTALGAFHEHGWISISSAELQSAIDTLDVLTETLQHAPDSPDHPLHGPLVDLLQRHPMIYGSGLLGVAARRWACQINENSKRAAQWGQLPEMNHNEVVAWIEGGSWGQRYAVVILDDEDAPDDVRKRITVTRDLAESAGLVVHLLKPRSGTPLGRLLEATVLGDWLSYWLALAEGVDPTPIPPIETLKARLAKG